MNSDCDRFLSILRLRLAATTYYRKLYQLQAFFNYLSKQNLDYHVLTKADIERYLLSVNCSRSGRQQICRVIWEFYDYLETPFNPAKSIVFLPEKRNSLPQVPSQEVVESVIRILSAEATLLSTRNRLIIELAYGSGLRRGELIRLDIEDIDVAAQTAYIHGKGNTIRIVPLTGEAVGMFREYLAQRRTCRGPLLTTIKGKRLALASINYTLRHKAGIRPHMLRHACASHMLKNGCSTRLIQELLGHKRLTTTQVYTHIIKEDLSKVMHQCHPRNKS